MNPDLINESLRIPSSDKLNGPGLPGGGCGLLVSFITVLSAKAINGTLSGELQTAAAKRPHVMTSANSHYNRDI